MKGWGNDSMSLLKNLFCSLIFSSACFRLVTSWMMTMVELPPSPATGRNCKET
ncbi:MAG: hypothetical protein ACD_74C00112G0001 [uncultured bacterium]|nr:MAG: hypothetical protein ACD_74C00112G0001 [uncultured bacterium]